MAGVNLIGGNGGYSVYDGTSTDNNCTTLDRVQWTYSAGMLLNAAAIMYNLTGSSEWQTRANGLWSSSSVFFKDKIMYEVACEPQGNCDTDQLRYVAVQLIVIHALLTRSAQFQSLSHPLHGGKHQMDALTL